MIYRTFKIFGIVVSYQDDSLEKIFIGNVFEHLTGSWGRRI